MRQLLIKAVAASALLMAGYTANAQYQPRGEYRGQDYRARVIERAMGDLDRAEASSIPFTGDRNRLARAREELGQFQQRMSSGEYDRRDLDEAIVAIQQVLDANHVSERTRDFLADDLNRLRDLQSRMNN